jgi:putative transposase
LWVADFTYVATWVGVVYVAFVIDAYARRVLGWRAATSMRTQLVLDALDQAVWVRRREGADLAGLVHHTEPGQYTSITFTERLAAIGVSPSIGTVGDAYDNALAETVVGLYKTESINPNKPWKTVEEVEIATLHYVDWFNNDRLYEENGDIPPVELEQAHYRNCRPSA